MGYNKKIIYSLLLLWASGCNQPDAPDCLQTGGRWGEFTQEIQPFEELVLQDHIAYYLHQDNTYSCRIEGPKNLLNEIELKYNHHQLTISNNNTCNIVRSYKKIIQVHLYAPSFPSIIDMSTMSIDTPDTLIQSHFKFQQNQAASNSKILIHCDSIDIQMPYGVGDITLEGICRKVMLYNGSTGIIDSQHLRCQEIYFHQAAIQDVFIQNTGYAYVAISNKGNVYYTGTPNQLDLHLTGEGKYLPIP
jgi:hypothetical protein